MKYRYRLQKRWFRKPLLVLQIGIERKLGAYVGVDGDTCAPPHWNEEDIIKTWRDASFEDIQRSNSDD